jgi:Stage II sporulation protein E (SpoIIE)/Cache domain
VDPSQGPPLLRTRRGLLFTAFPAIAVLAALGVLLALAHHGSVVRDRHMETAALAAAASTNARRFVDDQFATLSAVAAAPAVRRQLRAVVDPYLRSVQESAGFTAGMGLIGRDAMVVASTNPIPAGGVSVADRAYVQAGLQDGRPAVSDVLIGKVNRRPVVTFGYPVAGPSGKRNGVVSGAVRLDEVSRALNRLLYAPGAAETLLDSMNRVIVGEHPVTGYQPAPRGFPVARMRARGHGVIDAVETNHGKRLLGYATVPGTGWMVVVDQDHGTVIGPLNRALWAEIVALGLLAMLGVLATLAGARQLDHIDAARDAALAEQRGIALQLQRSLLPDVPEHYGPLEVHASYAPAQGAMAIGGDWYDVVELGDGRVALSVGDVAGHGLGAAAVMGQLRSAARTLALDQNAGPAEVLQRLDSFASTLDGRPLATVVFAIADPASGELRYALAGHPPPLVLRADGTAELLQEGRSPLLGVDPVEPRAEGEARLAPGDTLVFYTDGLVERPESSIDAGIQRLIERALAAAARDPRTLATALIDGVPEPRRDDTAVLCVRLVAPQSSVAS